MLFSNHSLKYDFFFSLRRQNCSNICPVLVTVSLPVMFSVFPLDFLCFHYFTCMANFAFITLPVSTLFKRSKSTPISHTCKASIKLCFFSYLSSLAHCVIISHTLLFCVSLSKEKKSLWQLLRYPWRFVINFWIHAHLENAVTFFVYMRRH